MTTSPHTKTILMATGASGGHIFPSLAMAHALRDKGYNIVFALGGSKFSFLLENEGFTVESLPASAVNVASYKRKVIGFINMVRGFFKAIRLVRKYKPVAVVGVGGYGIVAAGFAAKIARIPVILHEANVLPGRANKVFMPYANALLLTFSETQANLKKVPPLVGVTGNPIRKALVDLAHNATYAAPKKTETFRLLVLGGSQGARVLSDVIPLAIEQLPKELQQRISIVHQARPEDVERVKRMYAVTYVAACLTTGFIENMAEELMRAHLVVGRSGAGVVTENFLFGRPAVYVPLPHNLADNHQYFNAKVAADNGAAVVMEQEVFTPENLSPLIQSYLSDTATLNAMARAAHKMAQPQAAATAATAIDNLITATETK